ncbi:MAG TPA: glycosyltransferase family 9 protein [Stellaceae bacterium]|nr:glycosyltransferase family 9 protein [Stellaceae bacterium]
MDVAEALAPRAEAALSLPAFRDRHRGETIVVCGCGQSLNELPLPPGCVTIGVNDVGRRFDPTYLVVVNSPLQFAAGRFAHVAGSRARFLFTQRDDLGAVAPPVVRFELGRFGGTDCDDPRRLHYTQNSPYVALCLAAHLGAARIGLIGVDFTDDHFFGATGRHPLSPHLAAIDRQYAALGRALQERGVAVVNLSTRSRLTAFAKAEPAAFLARPAEPAVRRLDIVSYATTPVAGVPAILARCIADATPHRAQCVWATGDYGNGVSFEGGVAWRRSPAEAARLIGAADLVIVHNGKVDPAHRRLLADKPVVTMAHNYRWNVDCGFVDAGFPGVVVGQYQAALPEFRGWAVVPNPVPVAESAYCPGEKPEIVTIAYTPSGRHERFPPDHRLYWHGKGYETTMRVLRRLAERHAIRVRATDGAQVPHAAALAMKREAHIVIDECVTGSYHRNSLEGLAAGCVVVNAVGLLPEIADLLRQCAGGAEPPFVFARLEDLEPVLEGLIALGPQILTERGAANRLWMERHWQFAAQWRRDWQPAIDAAVARSSTGLAPRRVAAAPPAQKTVEWPVSIVVPQGGRERLDRLRTTIEAARKSPLVAEIVVAEMDEAPCADDLARRLGAHYVFIDGRGGFNKARAVNVGTAMAVGDLVLWLDNDILLPERFLERAVVELRRRSLDCLIPWTSVHYLSEADSRAVIAGAATPAACRPVNAYHTRSGGCGGAVLLRRRLVEEFGGLCEAFRGWGGEDNAWFHKARVVARTAVTARADQHLFHLFHPNSGGYGSQEHIAANPHYQTNLALLHEMRRIVEPKQFLAHYPPPAQPPCPWARERSIALIADRDDGWARDRVEAVRAGLRQRFGIEAACDEAEDGETHDAVVVFGSTVPRTIVRSDRLIAVRRGSDEALPPARFCIDGDAADLAAALIAPLSMILGASDGARAPGPSGRAAANAAGGGRAVLAAAGGIGDLIRATPLVRVLAGLGHRVDFLIAADYPDCAELFRDAPEIDRVVVLPPLNGRAPNGRSAGLAGSPYDVAVLTHLAAPLAPFVGAAAQHLFDRDDWLARGDADCSEEIARALGWREAMPAPIARPSSRRFDLPEDTVVLHPGCKRNWPWKRWHGFADLAALLPAVAIVGTQEDRAEAGTYFRSRGGWPEHVRDYTGTLGLADTAALIAQSAALVSNDSGLMHLAVALGIPTFGIFGITNPRREIIAAPHMHVITKGLACEPDCRRQPYGRRDCERHLQCLKELTAAEVLDKMQRLMPRPLPAVPMPAPRRVPAASASADVLTVAIQLEGGLGDIIIAAGFVEALHAELGRCDIDVFHHTPDWAKFVFRDARFVRNVLPLALHRTNSPRYDVAVYAPQFVHYQINNPAKLERLNPAAAARIRLAGERFAQYRGLFDRRPQLDGLWARMSLAQGRTIFGNLDFLSGLEAAAAARFFAPDPLAAEPAARLIGDNALYITIHDGFDTSQKVAAGAATKLWPLDRWAAFVADFKTAFPEVAVVQLGAGKSRPIPGADINLIGRTTLAETAWLLKRAALHVDTDSGLVHLARLVHTRSVVLFGPTDAAFYGYGANCNIASERCGKCWWSAPDWLARCPRGLPQPECMASIEPGQVLDRVRRRLARRRRPVYRLVAQQLYDAAPPATPGTPPADLFARLDMAPVPISRHAVDPASGVYLHASKQWEYPFALRQIAGLEEAKGGPLRIADVGAGRGALAPYLAKLGHRVEVFDRDYLWDHGGDPDVERRYVRWAAEQGYTARYGSLYNLPAEGAAYDVVLSISVVEHVYAKQLAIAELLRLVRPGGLVVLTFDFAVDPTPFQDGLRLEIFGPAQLAEALARFGIDPPGFTEREIDESARAMQCDQVLGIPAGMTVGGIAILRQEEA